MFAKRMLAPCILGALACFAVSDVGHAGDVKTSDKKVEKTKEVWTDASDTSLPADFKFQGEYVGKNLGCQVIALGHGMFQAVVESSGLPGAGWDGKNKMLLDGKLEGDKVVFTSAKGKRKYLAQSPSEFSATAKFPPIWEDKKLILSGGRAYTDEDKSQALMLDSADNEFCIPFKKTIRKSPTLGMKAPEGAIVLFNGASKDEWNGGRVDQKSGFLNTDGKDITTKRKFNTYTAHVEFLLPYRPDARGQGRGNSGFYQVDQYEVQILDSFGLEGMNNECGGIYSLVKPAVNMCLPPLQWQTYDVEFTNAVCDDSGKKIKNSRITLKHNGVVIHDNVELKGKTGGARNEPEGTPGVLRLQGHGNPLQFRNIWVIEKK